MSLVKVDTDFPADSVEFCPHPEAQDVLACGTYKLQEGENNGGRQRRSGKCMVFTVGDADQLSKLHEISLPAILDMKWCHTSPFSSPTLGIADSEGNVSIHTWSLTEKVLTTVLSIPCAPSEVLCLSLDWSNRRYPSDGLGSLIVSLSDGRLSLLHPHESTLTIANSWRAHEYEPWVAAWDYWDANVVFSGGDDLTMKGWDIRQGFKSPIFVNKSFDGGITSIQSHPLVEHVLAVGSYDNTVRLFDVRKPLVPLTYADVAGGAWRVKWHPSEQRKNDLLVACMHDGFKILTFNLEQSLEHKLEYSIAKRFDEHASLAYGADWSFAGDHREGTLVASCSFYDHVLCLWRG